MKMPVSIRIFSSFVVPVPGMEVIGGITPGHARGRADNIGRK